ncbi:MAG: IS630 family transposase [Pseudomonadota bacterium]
MRKAVTIVLTPDENTMLHQWVRATKTPDDLKTRAKIVLAAATGMSNDDIAAELTCSSLRVSKWRNRFASLRLDGILHDAPRSGRPACVRQAKAHEIVETTTRQTPKSQTHWSTRSLARTLGVSHMTVQRVWKANQLKPHLVRTFKISNDPHFAQKLIDVVGLYLNPPEHALVLSVDEKSQIQALDRTQPTLPLKRGRCGTMTHDYKRNGTTTLFAALNVAEGRIIGTCMKRHRHQEWIKFLEQIDRQTDPDLELHLIIDNYATHKHPRVKRWLKRHPRFHVHFTPTSSSWLNLIERWFREITEKRIRRGTFSSVGELIAAITDFIQTHNEEPKSFQWTAKAETILKKVARARAVLDNQ